MWRHIGRMILRARLRRKVHATDFHSSQEPMPKAIRSTRKATPRVNKTVSLKVDEARELDRAARRDGLEFSTWARATLLDRARNPKEAA